MKKYFVYIFVIGIIISSCTQSGSPGLVQRGKAERIDELFTRYTDSGEFSGAVLVVKEDQVLLREGYGFANREEQIPNTPETLISIQSVRSFLPMLPFLWKKTKAIFPLTSRFGITSLTIPTVTKSRSITSFTIDQDFFITRTIALATLTDR